MIDSSDARDEDVSPASDGDLPRTREELERRLADCRASEERYALAVDGAGDGIWDWDLERDTLFFSARWKQILGLGEDEMGSSPDEWFERVHPGERDGLLAAIGAHRDGDATELHHEYRLRHRDGTYRWVLTRGRALRDADGRARRMSGSQTDVTQRRASEELLLYDAFYDSLTGLPNRALFMDRLGRVVERAKRNPEYSFVVLFLDLDGFKWVNDTLGHAVGDRLLRDVARRLRRCVRPSDTVARLGGDEFTILLEDASDVDAAVQVTRRIDDALAASFSLDPYVLFVSASIGIAGNVRRYARADELLRDADIAMYRAKSGGAGRHVIFDEEMHGEAVAKLQLQTELRRALDQDELRLFYQPIVSLERSTIAGFEALVRWQHPQRGLIAPAHFIPMAEETGIIVPLGLWVLREACRQLNRWRHGSAERADLFVSVNLSGKQLALRNLRQEVNQILHDADFCACNLKLEISEGAFVDHADAATDLLRQLGEIDVGLCIDDFGTGHTSILSLRDHPVDLLKVDRSLIGSLPDDRDNAEIVRAAVSLARSLRLEVIAEGVETGEQLAILRSMGCAYAQGFLFSHPLDADSTDALLSAPPRWLDSALLRS